MKIIKRILYFSILFLLFPIISNASSLEIVGIESIINVSKDRIANIEEKIDLYIIEKTNIFEKHIDKNTFFYRNDGSKVYIESVISNISSKNIINTEENNKQKIIKLKLDGIKDNIETINLKYNKNLGKDKSKKYDEFYYNIITTDNIASNIAFEITFPEDVKINKVEFAIDDKYNLSSNDVTYTIEDNVITGYLNIMMNENQKFSLRVELPNNYFKNVTDNFNYFKYLYLIFPLITFIIILKYWWKYARKNKFVEKITTDIPHNFDPVEVGYLYKGFIDENDLVVDLIYLANNGYIKIEENEDGYKLGGENTFKFIKNKNYKKNNAIQKLLFEGIFNQKDEAELKDIEYSYSSKIIDTKKMIDNKDNRLKIFNKDINDVKKYSLILLLISIFVLNIEPIKQLTNSYLMVPVSTIIMSLGFAIMFVFDIKGTTKKIMGLFLFIIILAIHFYSLIGQNQFMIIYIIEVILILISIKFYKKIPIRTLFGNKKLAEINAFKIGLLSMSEKELEEKINDNSNYFYDMMPYAIVLGITNEWLIKGKNIIKERPYWHISKEQFNINNEIKFFKNVIFTTSKVMIKAIYTKKESSQLEFRK